MTWKVEQISNPNRLIVTSDKGGEARLDIYGDGIFRRDWPVTDKNRRNLQYEAERLSSPVVHQTDLKPEIDGLKGLHTEMVAAYGSLHDAVGKLAGSINHDQLKQRATNADLIDGHRRHEVRFDNQREVIDRCLALMDQHLIITQEQDTRLDEQRQMIEFLLIKRHNALEGSNQFDFRREVALFTEDFETRTFKEII